MLKPVAVAALVACLAAPLAAQPRTAVFDFQPVGVDSALARAAAVLLANRMAETGAFTIVNVPPGTRCYTVEDAVAIGKELGAEQAVIGDLVQLGPKLILSYKLVSVDAARVDLADRSTLASAEDLDIASERIARALKEKRPYASTIEAGTATEAEARDPFRSRSPFSSVMFTTGYMFPVWHRFPDDPGLMLFTIDASITYETRGMLTQAMMQLRRGKNNFQDIGFDLLGHKMFSTRDISPYLGGGIGIHRLTMRADSDYVEHGDDGLNLTASGGVVLYRTYYFRVLLGARGSVLFTQDLGTSCTAGFNFGLTSPALGTEGLPGLATPCILGCLGAIFIAGVVLALTT